jgi:hypothetical protein
MESKAAVLHEPSTDFSDLLSPLSISYLQNFGLTDWMTFRLLSEKADKLDKISPIGGDVAQALTDEAGGRDDVVAINVRYTTQEWVAAVVDSGPDYGAQKSHCGPYQGLSSLGP